MAYLVTVKGDRIALRPGQTYVLGRGSDCDIVTDDGACSRRHARITMPKSGEAAIVEDLGSRNGTFVGGELVRTRLAAREGARIQLGGTVYLVRLDREVGEVDLTETGTLTFDQQYGQDLDGGELSQLGLLDLLGMVCAGNRSVTIQVAIAGEQARIEVRDGEVFSAECGGLQGFNALVRVGRQTAGIFWLVETEDPCERQITDPSARLLAELRRCLDPTASTRPA